MQARARGRDLSVRWGRRGRGYASHKLAEYVCTVGLEVYTLLGSKGADLRRRFGIDAQELELGGWNPERNQYCTIVPK